MLSKYLAYLTSGVVLILLIVCQFKNPLAISFPRRQATIVSTDIICQADLSNNSPTCTCPTANHTPSGFPFRTNLYDACHQDDTNIIWIQIIDWVVSLAIITLIFIVARKRSLNKFVVIVAALTVLIAAVVTGFSYYRQHKIPSGYVQAQSYVQMEARFFCGTNIPACGICDKNITGGGVLVGSKCYVPKNSIFANTSLANNLPPNYNDPGFKAYKENEYYCDSFFGGKHQSDAKIYQQYLKKQVIGC
jgi:hypothetical protein